MVNYLKLTLVNLKSFNISLFNEMELTNEYVELAKNAWVLKKGVKNIKNDLEDYDRKLSHSMPHIIDIETVLLDLSKHQEIREMDETKSILETAHSFRSFPQRILNNFTWRTKGKNITLWTERVMQKARKMANEMEPEVIKPADREMVIEVIRKYRRLKRELVKDVKEHGFSSEQWEKVYRIYTIEFQGIKDEIGNLIEHIFGNESFLDIGNDVINAMSHGYEHYSLALFKESILPKMDGLINKIKIDQKITEGEIEKVETELEKSEKELFDLKNTLKVQELHGKLNLEIPKILVEIGEQAREVERIAGSRFDAYQLLTQTRKRLIAKLEEAKLDKEDFYSELVKTKGDIDPKVQPNEQLGEKGYETYSLVYQSIAKKISDYVGTRESTLENLKKEFKLNAG